MVRAKRVFRNVSGSVLAVLAVCSLAGCQTEPPAAPSASEHRDWYEGYLALEEDELLVNDFQMVYAAEKDVMKVLELTEADMPNGFCIYDSSDEVLTFTLNDKTQYTFYDTGPLFVPEDSEDRLYTTADKAEFLQKFDEDGDGDLGRVPFVVKVSEDGQVISVNEIFVN